MFHLYVELLSDRVQPGTAMLVDAEGDQRGFWSILGKADNGRAARAHNAARHPGLPYGDTPSGIYHPSRIVMFAEEHERIGKGWLPLTGAYGMAKWATTTGGRTGLGLHAGRGNDRLVPTFGCLRLRDQDFDRLRTIIGDDPIRVIVVEKP